MVAWLSRARENGVSVLYDRLMVPLEVWYLRRIRRTLIRRARGHTLEVGAGSGANAPHYHSRPLRSLTVTDYRSRERVLGTRYRRRIFPSLPITVGQVDVMDLPFPDASFDTVVATLLFCSVPDAAQGLREVRRVLKPHGQYLFLEHVRPPRRWMGHLFDLLNPFWHRLSRGCNLNRDTVTTLKRSGFTVHWSGSKEGEVFVWGGATPYNGDHERLLHRLSHHTGALHRGNGLEW